MRDACTKGSRATRATSSSSPPTGSSSTPPASGSSGWETKRMRERGPSSLSKSLNSAGGRRTGPHKHGDRGSPRGGKLRVGEESGRGGEWHAGAMEGSHRLRTGEPAGPPLRGERHPLGVHAPALRPAQGADPVPALV